MKVMGLSLPVFRRTALVALPHPASIASSRGIDHRGSMRSPPGGCPLSSGVHCLLKVV